MSELQMSKDQLVVYQELKDGIKEIKDILSASLPPDEGNVLMEALALRVGYLAYTPRLTSIAEAIHSWAMGEVSNEIIQSDLSKQKEVVIKMHIRGRMAYYDGLYEDCKKTVRCLEISIESIRTMISYLGKQTHL